MTNTRTRSRVILAASQLGLGLALISSLACAGDDEGGDTVAETSGEGSSTETSTSGATSEGDGDGDPGDETTGELMGCGAIDDPQACLEEPGCKPTMGHLLVDDGAGALCSETDEGFVGCANTSHLCPPLTKILCDGETVWQTQECVPDNVIVCEAPLDVTGPCT